MSKFDNYFVPTLNIIWQIIKSNNIDPEPIFNSYGLQYNALQDPNRRCHAHLEVALWDHANNIINQPGIGLTAGNYWHPSLLGSLGYAWLASETLHDALDRFSRFSHIVTNVYKIDVVEQQDKLLTRVSYVKHNPAFYIRSEALIAFILSMCRANYGTQLIPSCVYFMHPEPEYSNKYHDLFQCKIHFNSTFDGLAFSLDIANQQLPCSNRIMAEASDETILKILSELNADTFIDKVKKIIVEQLSSGHISENSVALKLNMSKRNMQIKLADEGVRFKELLDEAREKLAKKYLDNDNVEFTDIAFSLGFSETSSFSRAFKRWTGMTPRSYRKTTFSS